MKTLTTIAITAVLVLCTVHVTRAATVDTTRAVEFTLDPNTAPLDSLQLLPGIGPVKARAIIDYRQGEPFLVTDDLLNVSGIGAKTLLRIRPYLHIDTTAQRS